MCLSTLSFAALCPLSGPNPGEEGCTWCLRHSGSMAQWEPSTVGLALPALHGHCMDTAWTLHGWTVAHLTHTSPVQLGLICNNLGSCFTHPFSYASRRAFAAFRARISTSPLGRHRIDINGVRGWMSPGSDPWLSLWAQEMNICPLTSEFPAAGEQGWPCFLLGSHSQTVLLSQ